MRFYFSALTCFSAAIISGSGGAAAVPFPLLSSPVSASMAGPALLGTLAVPIRADRFNDSLRRAHEDASASPLLQRLIAPVRRLGRTQQIAYVQDAVSSNIRWASDATEWGQHDYWASASETLARGAGDMEDRAIVKMQALKALGFDPSSLFLTLARDRVGGPETVLTVSVGGQYYILDDTGGTPFPVEQRRYEFQPIISFGWNSVWLHTRVPSSKATTTTATAATTIIGVQARP
jgi:predicted transglutaminase-like cysteine proteinase